MYGPDIDAFAIKLLHKNCEKGIFVSFYYSDDMLQEIELSFRRSNKISVTLMVQKILDEPIAKQLV